MDDPAFSSRSGLGTVAQLRRYGSHPCSRRNPFLIVDGFPRLRFIGQRVFTGGPVAMLNTILLMILTGMILCGMIVIVFEIAANRKLRLRR